MERGLIPRTESPPPFLAMTPRTINTGLGPNFFVSASQSSRTFRSALGEIIDNAIAATPTGARGLAVDVYVRENPTNQDLLDFIVTDGGTGMSKSFVETGLFLLGQSPPGGIIGPFGYLNQFGFGLKYSLPWLTAKTGLEFDLRTGSASGPGGKPEYTCVHAKLSTTSMQLDTCPPGIVGTLKHFNEGVSARGVSPRLGTRLRFSCEKQQAFSGWEAFGRDRSDVTFPEFIKILKEHLGLTYRELVPQCSVGGTLLVNSIKLRTIGATARLSRQYDVTPVPVPFSKERKTNLHIFTRKTTANVAYRRGILDAGAHREVYHLHTEETQGFDVVVNGKVVESAVFRRIWGRGTHDTFNYLTGEIKIDVTRGEVPLVSSKDSLDWGSDFAYELVKEIRKRDLNATNLLSSFYPKPPAPPKAKPRDWRGDERDLRDLLKESLDRLGKGHTEREHTSWDRPLTGIDPKVAADLTYSDPRGFLVVETKWPIARPDDVYQLRLYWDGFCHSSTSPTAAPVAHPTVGVLIGGTFTPGTTWLAKYLSGMACPCGRRYKIYCYGWRNLGLPPRFAGGKANDKAVDNCLTRWFK